MEFAGLLEMFYNKKEKRIDSLDQEHINKRNAACFWEC